MNKIFCNILKSERNNRGLLQSELAKKLGTSTRRISYLECGKIEPDLATLVNIAKLFDVSTDYLLGLDD